MVRMRSPQSEDVMRALALVCCLGGIAFLPLNVPAVGNAKADPADERALDLTAALTQAGSPNAAECIRGLKALPECAPAVRDELVVKAVTRACRRPEPEVRATACRVAGKLIQTAPAYRYTCHFAGMLGDSDKTVRQAALAGLGHSLVGSGSYLPDEIRMLVRLLKDDDPVIRAGAYGLLGLAGEKACLRRGSDLVAGVAPVVIEKLETEPVGEEAIANESNLLCMAVHTLGRVGRRSPGAVPALLKVYDRFPADTKRDAGMRETVVQALAEIGPYSDKGLPFLAKLMGNEKLPIHERAMAAWAVGRFGPAAADLVPDMMALLRVEIKQPDPPRGTGERIIDAFVWLGETAEPAVPLLLELAQGPADAAATEYAIRALGDLSQVARKRAAPVFAKLYFAEEKHRQERYLGIGLIKFEDATVPLALDALKNGDVYAQEKAINLLQQLGPDARPAIPTLKRIAADTAHALQDRAKAALQRIDR